MHILISGGTGFIGNHLSSYLLSQGYKITILTRAIPLEKKSSFHYINSLNNKDSYDVIINLAGTSINSARWNDKVKNEIYNSRINSTQKIIDYIEKTDKKPSLFINGSAIGFYGTHPEKQFIESTNKEGSTFLSNLCEHWENIASKANSFNVRTCYLRTGIVLGSDGGALKSMIIPFKLGLGAVLGSGTQFMSWIHIDDVVHSILFIIQNKNIDGPCNIVAPNPVTNKDFSKTLARLLHRPCLFSIPRFVIKILLGEMGLELLLNSQYVVPDKLVKNGYKFKYPNLTEALENIELMV